MMMTRVAMLKAIQKIPSDAKFQTTATDQLDVYQKDKLLGYINLETGEYVSYVAGHAEEQLTVRELLGSYKCQYTTDEEGDGLTLIDMLTPPNQATVELGRRELDLLVDHLEGEFFA